MAPLAHASLVIIAVLLSSVYGEVDESDICIETCDTSNDGTCDDGGWESGSLPGCYFGTDCTDCGVRTWPYAYDGTTMCNDDCDEEYGDAYNNICEDGAPDAAGSSCYLGDDCTDCGVRRAPVTAAPPTQPPQATTTLADLAGDESDSNVQTWALVGSLLGIAAISGLASLFYLFCRYKKKRSIGTEPPNENTA